MGARASHESRFGGHASISDDGSGNVLIADGAQILGDGGTNSFPFVATKTDPDNGLEIGANVVAQVIGGSRKLYSTAAAVNVSDDLYSATGKGQRFGVSTDVAITGTGFAVTSQAGHDKYTADGVYTLLNAMTAGGDGQMKIMENIGSNQITFQEGIVLAAGEIKFAMYSTDLGAWKQVTL